MGLIDRSGKRLGSWAINDISLFSEENLIPQAISMAEGNPMVLTNGSFYLTGFSLGEWKREEEVSRPVVLKYDINKGKTEYLLSYPQAYQQKKLGWV